jgi:hypothetical protein
MKSKKYFSGMKSHGQYFLIPMAMEEITEVVNESTLPEKYFGRLI